MCILVLLSKLLEGTASVITRDICKLLLLLLWNHLVITTLGNQRCLSILVP